MIRGFLLTLFLALLSLNAFAQSAEEWLDQAESAREGKFYQNSLDLLHQGGEMFPEDYRFPFQKAELLLEQKLYLLALDGLKEAQAIDPEVPELWSRFAEVLGYLDRNDEAVPYLEKMLGDDELHNKGVRSLSWVLFKLHRLKEAEALLLSELEKEFQKSYAHTLGTVYAGMYEYELSRQYYQQSIDAALDQEDELFAAIAFYNLSILEYSYYNFEASMDCVNRSLKLKDRGSGHNARGELLMLKLDFPAARAELMKGDLMSENPLSTMDLISLYLQWGLSEEALLLLKNLEDQEDRSWMIHFGIDTLEMELDVSDYYQQIYHSLYLRERMLPGSLRQCLMGLKYRILHRFYRFRYRQLAHQMGTLQLEQENWVHGRWMLFEGSSGEGAVSMEFLSLAREEEIERVPKAAVWYLLEEGIESGSEQKIMQAFEQLDPEWEASQRARAMAERLKLLPPKEAAISAYSLYEMQSGAFLREGLKMSFHLRILPGEDKENRWATRSIKRILSFAGWVSREESCPYELSFKLSGQGIQWYFTRMGGEVLRQGMIEEIPRHRRDWKQQLRHILIDIFQPPVS